MRFWHFTTFILGIVALWLLAPNGYISSWFSTQSAHEKELENRIRSELEKPHTGNSEQDADSDEVGRAFRLMSATCSDRSRPAVPIDVGRGGGAPARRM